MILGCFYPMITTASAASITVHNYVTNDTYSYSGTQVTYRVNNKLVSTEYPGMILSNGAAVGPFQEVFANELGVATDYTDGNNSFSITLGSSIIRMTLGNTEATVNGVKTSMNNAPFVYSFQNSTEKHLYVPTRFVAENLGFVYTWDEGTSVASIQRANIIYDGKEKINYTGNQPAFVFNNTRIESNMFSGYVFDKTVFFEAEEYFHKPGLASYYYEEGSGLLLFRNGPHTVRLVLDSPVAYIGNEAHLLPSVPRLITPQNAAKAKVYIPAEFVATGLGYDVIYHETANVFYVTGTRIQDNTDNSSPDIPNFDSAPESSDELTVAVASYKDQLFSYETHQQVIDHYNKLGQQVPLEISGYTCNNSDALYLKGVEASRVKISDKYDELEIVISGYKNPLQRKTCYNTTTPYLNYCYFSGTDSIKIIIIKTRELHYYTYATKDGCVIHFTNENGLYQDYLSFVPKGNIELGNETEGTTDLSGNSNSSQQLPVAVFTRDHFVIRLPENIDTSKITDSDEYMKQRFTISIPGNHMTFLSEQDTYNPVKTLKNVQFSYKVSDDKTILTFNTTKIQGYSMTIADGFLALKIADPSEIYDKIIVLDAGHGGIDPGTLRNNVYEKNVNFNVINLYAAEYFKDSDIKVYFTRTTDTKIALQTRADFAKTVDADLFISFHVNANSNSAVNGTSVYYSASNNKTSASGLKSSLLAKSVVDHLSTEWNTKNRGILTERFVVIHNNTVPAVLVECGFITNNNDFEKIRDSAYQKKAAKALFDAVSEIFDKYPTGR